MQLPCSTSALPDFLPVGLGAPVGPGLPAAIPAGDAAAFDGALAACLAVGTPALPDDSPAPVVGGGPRPPSSEGLLGFALGRAGGPSGVRLLAGIGRQAMLPEAGSEKANLIGLGSDGLADTVADQVGDATGAGPEEPAELAAGGARREELPPPATVLPEVSWMVLTGVLTPPPAPWVPDLGSPNVDDGVASDVAAEMEGDGTGMASTLSDWTASEGQRVKSSGFAGQAGSAALAVARGSQVPVHPESMDSRASLDTRKPGAGSAPDAGPAGAGKVAPSPEFGGPLAGSGEDSARTSGVAVALLARGEPGQLSELRERSVVARPAGFGEGLAAIGSSIERRPAVATRALPDPVPSAGADSRAQGGQPADESLPRPVPEAWFPGLARTTTRDAAAFPMGPEKSGDTTTVKSVEAPRGGRSSPRVALPPVASASPARITGPGSSGLEGVEESSLIDKKNGETALKELDTKQTSFGGIMDAKSVLSMHDHGSTAAAPVGEVTPGASRVEDVVRPEGTAVASAHQAVESVMVAVDRVTHHSRQSVSLDLSVAGEPLQVRVELHAGEVRATFRTESSELRAALEQEWQARPIDSGTARVVTPVFSASSEQSWSGADGQGARRQRQPELPADPGAFSLSGGARRQDPVVPSPTAPVRPLSSRSHQLYSLA